MSDRRRDRLIRLCNREIERLPARPLQKRPSLQACPGLDLSDPPCRCGCHPFRAGLEQVPAGGMGCASASGTRSAGPISGDESHRERTVLAHQQKRNRSHCAIPPQAAILSATCDPMKRTKPSSKLDLVKHRVPASVSDTLDLVAVDISRHSSVKHFIVASLGRANPEQACPLLRRTPAVGDVCVMIGGVLSSSIGSGTAQRWRPFPRVPALPEGLAVLDLLSQIDVVRSASPLCRVGVLHLCRCSGTSGRNATRLPRPRIPSSSALAGKLRVTQGSGASQKSSTTQFAMHSQTSSAASRMPKWASSSRSRRPLAFSNPFPQMNGARRLRRCREGSLWKGRISTFHQSRVHCHTHHM